MALTNAERQRRFRQQQAERAQACVTPGDIRRAAQLLYEHLDMDAKIPFEEWAAQQHGGRSAWYGMLPDPTDVDYCDFPPGDAALLERVRAVVEATRRPPSAEAV